MFTEVSTFRDLLPEPQRAALAVGQNLLELSKYDFARIKRAILYCDGLRIQSTDERGRIRKNVHLNAVVVEKLTVAGAKKGMLFKPFAEHLLTEISKQL